MAKGFVYLVGAGPGRADLITLRGKELLSRADCIICDRLVNPALLRFAPPDAEIINVPKGVGTRSYTQQQINELLLAKSAEHETIVRLKGGDPTIFSRAAEELAALADAGIDFEIVPGVTAAAAAAGFAGILLTDRACNSQVVFVTGREADDKQQSSIDFNRLAKFGGTIVIYMGVGSLALIAERLVENGMKQDTPAAVIADATLPTQNTVKAPLREIAGRCKSEGIEPPAIILIGGVAAGDTRFDWFSRMPFFGKSIVVTRDARGNAESAEKVINRGGKPIELSTIRIVPLTEKTGFISTLTRFGQYDWVVFTSRNGVNILFEVLGKLGKDARVFASVKVAAIGPQTAGALAEFGIRPELVPGVFTAKELGRELIALASLEEKKILLLRSRSASKDLPALLEKAKAVVDDVAVYDAVPMKSDCAMLQEQIAGGKVDWLTFASPSEARMFFQQVPVEIVNSSRTKVASIGPVTSEQLRQLGIAADIEASEHTVDGLLAAIEGIAS